MYLQLVRTILFWSKGISKLWNVTIRTFNAQPISKNYLFPSALLVVIASEENSDYLETKLLQFETPSAHHVMFREILH